MSTQEIEKDKSRLEVLKRIEEYEKKGWFSKDVEDDPPTIPLTPDKVDYLNKKLKNKIATFFVNIIAVRFIKKLVKKGCTMCLGSDAHNTDSRPTRIAEAKKIICNKFGENLFYEMQENAELILHDDYL